MERPIILFSYLIRNILSIFFDSFFTNPSWRIRRFFFSCISLSASSTISFAIFGLILTKFFWRNAVIKLFSDFEIKSWRSPIFTEEGWDLAYFGSFGNEEANLLYIFSLPNGSI